MSLLRSALYQVHAAIYARLCAQVKQAGPTGHKRDVAIYGYVPEQPRLPYVQLGEFVEMEFATKLRSGSTVTATFHLWSDFQGLDELHDLSNQVIGALVDPYDKNRTPLVLSDKFAIVQTTLRLNQTAQDGEGREQHGVIMVDLIVEDTTNA